MSDNPNEQIGSARDSPPEGQDESTNLVQNNVQEARLRVNSPIPRPDSSEPRRVIGNPPTVVTVTPTTMMPPLFSFLPGLTQPRLSMPLMIESTPVARNITAETDPTDVIRQRTPIPSDTLSSEDNSNGNMIFQVENALAQAATIQRENRESVARDPITFIPTDVIRNRVPIPNVSLPSQDISVENIILEAENALAQAEIQQREHAYRNARRNEAAARDLITIMPNIGGTLPTNVVSQISENALFQAEYALAQADILQREHLEAEARRREVAARFREEEERHREAAFRRGEEIARGEVGLITHTLNRSRRMLGNMRNRFPRLRLSSVGDDVVYSDGEND